MDQKELNRLNKIIADELGSAPNGEAMYKWSKASDLKQPIRVGNEEYTSPGGLILMRPKCVLRSWADIGGYDYWVVAHWRGPTMSEQAWDTTFGNFFPYPSRGDYLPVANAHRPIHEDPDEVATRFAVMLLRKSIDRTTQTLLSDLKDQEERDKHVVQGRVDSFVDDIMPAFGNIPGEKLHVSFPTPGQPEAKEKKMVIQ
jgi:hypothetical protein